VDLEEAIQKSSAAAKIAYAPFPAEYSSYPAQFSFLSAMGFGFDAESKEYRLVFHLVKDNETDRNFIEKLCHQVDVGELPKVKITGEIEPFCLRSRPLERGFSISPLNYGSSGTIGCFVEKRDKSDEFFLLSCTHVLAPSNNPHTQPLIVHPGGSSLAVDQVALLDLATFTPLINTSIGTANNSMDAALAKLICPETIERISSVRATRHYYTEKELSMLVNRRGNTRVFKIGGRTGSTSGYINREKIELPLRYRVGVSSYYKGIFTVDSDRNQPFSLGGDSGSLVYDEDERAIGLVFAGTINPIITHTTYILPIERVLKDLNINLI
jgi:hypothetical protein